MIRNTFIAGATYVALSVGFLAGSSPVVADPQVEPIENVTVVAPRIEVKPSPMGFSHVRTARRDARLNLDDLDLTRTADRQRLVHRAHEAANRVCQELRNDLPFGQPEMPLCINQVVNDVLAQVEQRI